MRVWYVVTLGVCISLIGTMLGAFIGTVVRNPSKKFLANIIGFSGGLMLAVVVFELVPDAMEKGSVNSTLIFFVVGMVTILIIDVFSSRFNFSKNSHVKVATMTALALMLHNLPEGVIMGCGFLGKSSLGFKMCLIIGIHDIPEGMAVASPLMASKVKKTKILGYALVTTLPTAIGAWVGVYIGGVSDKILATCLALASGVMLYVVCGDMFPESTRLWEGVSTTVGILIGVLCGMCMVYFF